MEASIDVKAHGLFQRAKVIKDESAEETSVNISAISRSTGYATITTAASHLLLAGDLVVIAGVTPSGYNGNYVVTEVVDSDEFKVALASNPGAYSAGGTSTKQAMFYCDSVEGLVVGDLVKLYESVGGTYENATVTAIDRSNGIV